MADVAVNPTASYTVAADVVGTVGYQRIKLDVGASGATSGDVGATNPLPVTGTMAVSGAVQVSGTVTVAGSVSVSGTAVVSVVPGVSVTIQQGASVSAVVSGTVTVNGSVSVSGTGLVSVVPGVSVIAQVSGTVTIAPTTLTVNTAVGTTVVSGTITAIPIDRTAATPDAAATGQIVWVANPGAAVATTVITVNTIAAGFSVNALVTGVVSVSVMPSVAISTNLLTTGVPAAASTGIVVWNAGINITTGFPAANATGQIVWDAALLFTAGLPIQASTAQIVVVKPAPLAPVMIKVTGTAIAQSAGKYLFTIWTGATGAPAAAGTTSWAVPAGKVLRLCVLQAACTSSAVLGGSIQVFVGVGATASMISASISTQLQLMKLQMFGAAALQSAAIFGAEADVNAGESIAVFVAASTAAVLRDLLIVGKLF